MKNNKTIKSLPPLVSEDSKGNLKWQSQESIDYDSLGYFLSCHLIIEHYIDNVLKCIVKPTLGWDEARLTFSQKLSLLGKTNFFEGDYNFLPSLKHLNKIRNKLSHNISYKLTVQDIMPIKQKIAKQLEESDTPETLHFILEFYTSQLCAYCAGTIWSSRKYSGK